MNYHLRREKILNQMVDHSMMIIYSDKPNYQNFYYLTGIYRDNMILTIEKTINGEAIKLYIQKPDPFFEKWNGKRMSTVEAKEISGIDEVNYVENFETGLIRNLGAGLIHTLYFNLNRTSSTENPDINEIKSCFYKEKFPYLEIKNAYSMIGILRMAKDEDEVNEIKTAIKRTENALNEVMCKLKPGLYEYQVQADFEYSIKYQGSLYPAFDTIAGSGYNGTMLHYGTNHCLCQDGDLILLDLGAECNRYCADITRTYPINGKFTARQKQIYDIVLKANLEIIKAAKPGVTPMELNELCKDILSGGLIELGLIKERSEIVKYYMHGVSHHLGIDVHDVTIASNQVLQPGCVITDEPGLYIEEENIGIRIEDDLLITENGCIVLSKDIIKTTDEIEAYIAEFNIDK